MGLVVAVLLVLAPVELDTTCTVVIMKSVGIDLMSDVVLDALTDVVAGLVGIVGMAMLPVAEEAFVIESDKVIGPKGGSMISKMSIIVGLALVVEFVEAFDDGSTLSPGHKLIAIFVLLGMALTFVIL
jgi:hypothetical protein